MVFPRLSCESQMDIWTRRSCVRHATSESMISFGCNLLKNFWLYQVFATTCCWLHRVQEMNVFATHVFKRVYVGSLQFRSWRSRLFQKIRCLHDVSAAAPTEDFADDVLANTHNNYWIAHNPFADSELSHTWLIRSSFHLVTFLT